MRSCNLEDLSGLLTYLLTYRGVGRVFIDHLMQVGHKEDRLTQELFPPLTTSSQSALVIDSGMSHRGPQIRPVFQILVCHLATASSELVTSAAGLREKIIAAGPDSTSNFELTAGDVVRPPSIVQCQHLAKGSTRQAHAHFQRWSGRLLTPSACCAVIRRPDDANQRPNRDDQRADHF